MQMRSNLLDALTPVPLEEIIKNNNFLSSNNRFGRYTFYKGWFIHKKLFGGYKGIKAIDVCWVYPIKTNHSINFIPTGTTFHITVKTRQFETAFSNEESMLRRSNLKPPTADYVLRKLSLLTPWAFFGYSAYLHDCWNTNRELFLNAVDARIKAINLAIENKNLIIKEDGSTVVKKPFKLPEITMRFVQDKKGKAKRVYSLN
jgi:hypothetical protein